MGTASGDLMGTFVQAGAAVQFADGTLSANNTLVFSETVIAGGSGTATMRSTGFNRAGVTSGEIVIVEGSGTGDLAALEGRARWSTAKPIRAGWRDNRRHRGTFRLGR